MDILHIRVYMDIFKIFSGTTHFEVSSNLKVII